MSDHEDTDFGFFDDEDGWVEYDDDYDDEPDSDYDDFDWSEYYPQYPRLQIIRWALIRIAQRLHRKIVYFGKHDPQDDIPF